MLGRFDPAFLEVPQEVIQLTARVNQKYFVCHDSNGKLANAFVCTANIDAHDGGAAIVAGNEKVLAARLSDAKFFWEQDLKVKLDDQATKLAQITFHEKLGSVADKVERVARLARWLVEEGIVKGANADDAERAARLCKADLVTGMVGEFPELQGLMGGYYARAQGETDAVADAARDHYKPVGQGDDVPTAPVTVAVSLADKLDTLVGFFQIDEKPTGSKDPFALRRAAIGILSLILENNLRVSMRDLITVAAHDGGLNAGLDIANFLIDRLKVQQRDAGIRHDMIDAVVAVAKGGDNVLMVKRVKALQGFVGTDEGANLLAAYKRAANILKAADGVDAAAPAPADLVAEERALLTALDTAAPNAAAAVDAEDFEGAMAALASLRAPIDAFFDGVMVNDEDPAKRAFRLGLLARFRDAVTQVADFSKVEG
jgi:glycyl-tRNA synthetase beta chain